jgi:VIT1/CCC1 family predicted Fe2+/Mn2+ transporter
VAWGIVDGVMLVMLRLFERGRNARLARDVVRAADDVAALAVIEREFDERLAPLTTRDEREFLYRRILARVRSHAPLQARVKGGDLAAGAAAGLAIVLATVPIVVPFLVLEDVDVAVRVSNGIAIALLFLLGVTWARETGASPWRVAAGITLVGVLLVLVTIALGG